ncbi:MAG: integrase, partial [Elusimicrobia bacterium]|nr:integrase [Elusimicrobiota bacterium]
MPSVQARMEYLKAIYARYHQAAKKTKSRILEEFCKVNKDNRKYAIRLLNGPAPEDKTLKARKKRSFLYSVGALQVVEAIWTASGHLCGQRLKEAIPLWLPAAKKRFGVSPATEQEVLRISPRQLDNRLRAVKRRIKKRIYSTTRPGSLLKSMIPIRTSHWDIRKPGFQEVDLVAHCGNSASGTFIYTLNSTDLNTTWTERAAVLGKGQAGILNAVLDIKHALPFHLRGIDSDNGEEFINWHLLRFCRKSRPQIEFTRGRAYKKDDNAHVEQKNWTHVRQVFGWDRYDTEEALHAMNDLYEHELRWFQNFFQP